VSTSFSNSTRKLTTDEEIVHSTNVGLSLSSDRTNTVGLTTEALLGIVPKEVAKRESQFKSVVGEEKRCQINSPVSIYVVIESEFFSSDDVSLGKDTHPHVFTNVPFSDIAVGITTVIKESTFTTFLRCIEILRKQKSQSGEVRNIENEPPCLKRRILRKAHLIFLKHHKIEMLNPFIFVFLHLLHESFVRNDFTNVFIDELITEEQARK